MTNEDDDKSVKNEGKGDKWEPEIITMIQRSKVISSFIKDVWRE